jgi:Spy/CpxP family protein refolding chaperone
MRKLALLVSFALVASGTTIQAQGRGMGRASGRGGPGGPAMMMDRLLFKDITLTDAQKAKIEELRKAERDQMQAAGGRQGGAGADFEAIREAREKGDTATVRRLMADQRDKMETRRNERIAALRAILTSDQVAQFDANVDAMKKQQAEMAGRRGGPPRQP